MSAKITEQAACGCGHLPSQHEGRADGSDGRCLVCGCGIFHVVDPEFGATEEEAFRSALLDIVRAALSAIEESVSRTIAKSLWSRGDVAEFVDVEGFDVEGRSVSVGDRFVVDEVLPDGQLRAAGWLGAVLPYHVRRVEP